MGKIKDNRDAAPALYALLDFREKLKEFSELTPEVESSLKKTFQLLVKKSRNYDGYTEMTGACADSMSWDSGSVNSYPRKFRCLWCKEEWRIENSDTKNQCNCPNSCNVNLALG